MCNSGLRLFIKQKKGQTNKTNKANSDQKANKKNKADKDHKLNIKVYETESKLYLSTFLLILD